MSGLEYLKLALGIAESVLHLSQSLAQGLTSALKYGPGFEKARLALNLEAATFKSLKAVLFGPANTKSASSGVFTDFDQQTQLDIINILRQFHESLEAHYQLVSKVYEANSPSMLEITDGSTPFGSFHSASILRRLRWGFADKARFNKVITKLQCWNERLLRAVQVKLIQNEICRAGSTAQLLPSTIMIKMQQSNIVGDVETLGLKDDLQLARMSLDSPDGRSSTPTPLMIPDSTAYEQAPVLVESTNRRLVRLRSGAVLLESKEFNADEQGNPARSGLDRIDQLCHILQKPKSNRYHTLECNGYYCSRGQFVLTFTLPQHLAPNYTTLSARLQQSVPDLEDRFILARQLCATLAQLHTVGWVHKSFRSENILFFATSCSPEQAPTFENLYLSGWEYSRPELEFSSRHADADDIGENVYRHPDQWGLPTVRFNRMHDVYALGVVLLEIGRWKKAISFHPNKFRGHELGSVVKDWLIAAARDPKLRSSMGSRYQTIVLKCLQGSFGMDTAGNASQLRGTELMGGSFSFETFEAEVLDVVDEIICHL